MPLVIAGATSGSTTVQATDAVTATITLPSATTTLVGATTPSFTTTIGVGGATPSASGAGITFPATQSASTNANTLDDYEEGTFTPAIIGTTTAGAGTYSAQNGTYTKVGRAVSFQLYLQWSAHTGTGSMRVANLPFATSGAAFTYTAVAVGFFSGIALSAGYILTAYTEPSSTQITLIQTPVGGGNDIPVPIDAIAGIILSATYFV
jgi:hypothetical protein